MDGGEYQRRTQKGTGRTEKITHTGATKNPRRLAVCSITSGRSDIVEFFIIDQILLQRKETQYFGYLPCFGVKLLLSLPACDQLLRTTLWMASAISASKEASFSMAFPTTTRSAPALQLR